MITFGDKTTILTNIEKHVAQQTLVLRAPEEIGTLKPLWNKFSDRTITNYTPSTVTLDINNRYDTVFRKKNWQ